VIPYLGNSLVIFIWGRFSVDSPTLNRFFSLHFILPFILVVLIFIHLILLHDNGSRNPLGLNSKRDKVKFHSYFSLKDFLGFSFTFFLFLVFFVFPESFMEYQNFLERKPLVTPTHIQPEWYFLPAYAILRCVPNKLGGVIALVIFIMILFFSTLILS